MNLNRLCSLLVLGLLAGGLQAQNPDKALALYEQANKAFQERNFDKGFDLMEKALKKNPELAEAWYKLGSVYEFTMADQPRAIPNYIKAIALKPDLPAFMPAWFTLGQYYLKEGNYEAAKTHFEKFIGFNHPKSSRSGRQNANLPTANLPEMPCCILSISNPGLWEKM